MVHSGALQHKELRPLTVALVGGWALCTLLHSPAHTPHVSTQVTGRRSYQALAPTLPPALRVVCGVGPCPALTQKRLGGGALLGRHSRCAMKETLVFALIQVALVFTLLTC